MRLLPVRMLAGLVLALAALSPAPAPAQGGGTLTIGMSQFASTLHPSMGASVAKSYVLDMARRPITAYGVDWELICLACTELPTLENGRAVLEPTPEGGEGIALTYTLQPEATWGDGTPVTTDDVVFAWEVGHHPQSAYDNLELFRSIYAIDVIDDKTFTLRVDRVPHDYNQVNDLRMLPAHLERAVFEADPLGYPDRTLYNTDPTNPGLYFGPYRIVEVESGSYIVLEPNETWYGEPPHFDRIVVRTIENTAAMEANLLSGAIDMIAGELGLTLDQALAFEARHADRYNIFFQPSLIYEHIDLNLDNPLLADRRVRQALLYAIDRQTMTERLFQSHQRVATTNVSPLDWIYTDDVRQYAYDPARAAALFDAAGFSEIHNGIRHNAAGEPLAFTLMTTAGNRTRELVAQVLQSQWRDAGVDITIRNEPARVFFGGTLSERRFEAMAMFAWVSSPENVPRTVLHSDHIPTPENNWAGQNYMGFANAAMDTLIEAAEVELDRDRRAELWHWIQRIYAEELPVLPLYYRANPFMLPLWLDGVQPTGHLGSSTLWVETWRRVE